MEKVILILVDGMRPDGFAQCGNPFGKELLARSAYDIGARTVFPPVTLPCHMSLFHSVPPDRHGIVTNLYTPQVRPIPGLCEQLRAAGRNSAFFYSWEELRDLCRPDGLCFSYFVNMHAKARADDLLTDAAVAYLRKESPDFTFLYLGETDEAGHRHGWMGKEYLACIDNAISCVERVFRNLPEDTTLILTADHGGHGRSHGEEVSEDMTIPVLFCGKSFAPGKIEGVNILDIAPTVAKLLGTNPVQEWEGRSVL